MGVVTQTPFPTYPQGFPHDVIDPFGHRTGRGVLGNKAASGTEIIAELGEEHMRTGKPIIYTSADSVIQIAAHEEAFGLERLYALCRMARRLCDPYRIGRVIARPFLGTPESGFTRTGNRKDFSAPPPGDTILDLATRAGRAVVTVGKIGDIFAHRGTGEEIKPHGNEACLTAALEAMARLPDGGFVFANLVDFDTEFGHRRDVPGYAAALEAFDRRVPAIWEALGAGDLVVVSDDPRVVRIFQITGLDHTLRLRSSLTEAVSELVHAGAHS
jgi:phosphopentomutase